MGFLAQKWVLIPSWLRCWDTMHDTQNQRRGLLWLMFLVHSYLGVRQDSGSNWEKESCWCRPWQPDAERSGARQRSTLTGQAPADAPPARPYFLTAPHYLFTFQKPCLSMHEAWGKHFKSKPYHSALWPQKTHVYLFMQIVLSSTL